MHIKLYYRLKLSYTFGFRSLDKAISPLDHACGNAYSHMALKYFNMAVKTTLFIQCP